jgi:hypothetical protein
MTTEEIIRLIFSFLGGGLVSGILNWIRVSRSEKKDRRIKDLNDQIRNLYGPLYFFTSQNEKCFKLNDSILKAYHTEYVEEKYSQDDHTQHNLLKKTTLTLDLANAYVGLVTQNNEKIIEILKSNYSYIDPEDIDIFQQFVVDYNRLKTERDESGRLQTPLEIYQHVGEISFMRTEFIKQVSAKFISKKNKIDSLNR